MKQLLAIASLLVSFNVQAQINNSDNSPRHQAAILNAIEQKCGYMRDLIQVSQTEEIIRVDQGITDINYVTVLSGYQRLDQNIFDQYEIIVTSQYADMYDHSAQDWGAYFVDSVSCKMK